jgi:zinc finger protein
LNRQLVKADSATVRLPELDFEIPAATQRGVFTTVEGLLRTAGDALADTQPVRRAMDAAGADAVDAFLLRLRAASEGAAEALPFTLVLDDPGGNSFVENPRAPAPDADLRVRYYARSTPQNEALGLYAANARGGAAAEGGGGGGGGGDPDPADDAADGDGPAPLDGDERALRGSGAATGAAPDAPARGGFRGAAVRGAGSGDGNVPGGWRKGGARLSGALAGALAAATAPSSSAGGDGDDGGASVFGVDCVHCNARGEMRMCTASVPHFKEVLIACFKCEGCGFRDVEVKGGGAVPPRGSVHTLRVAAGAAAAAGLARDVIKGDTAEVAVPELDLVVVAGSLGGLYTTVEGLLATIRDNLEASDPYAAGATDSAAAGAAEPRRARMQAFLARLGACVAGEAPFTLVITDPMANSWVYSPAADAQPPAADADLDVGEYERSHDENRRLGLLDMRTEDYAEAHAAELLLREQAEQAQPAPQE